MIAELLHRLVGRRPFPALDIRGVVPAGADVCGDMNFSGGLWVDGKVAGNLRGAQGAAVVVNLHGAVGGDIAADHIRIHGEVNGSLHAREILVLESTARVRGGDICYQRLYVAEGAILQGCLTCEERGASEWLTFYRMWRRGWAQ